MLKVIASIAFLFCAAFAFADRVNPGEIHVLQAGDKDAKAKPGDIVVARIPNPALPKMVHDLSVKDSGGAKVVGVVNASDVIKGLSVPGSGHIRIYIAVEKGHRSGVVEYSYTDGAGEKHKQKLVIQVEGR